MRPIYKREGGLYIKRQVKNCSSKVCDMKNSHISLKHESTVTTCASEV